MLLTVVKSTSTSNGNFLHKLTTENKVETPLGNIVQKQTYYIFTDSAKEAGTKIEWDLLNDPNVEIVKQDRTFKDSDNKEITVTLKYIFPKK